MLVLLPLAALALAMLTLGACIACGRLAALAGAVAWGVALTAITEALSVFGLLSVTTVAGAWALACLCLLALGLRAKRIPLFTVDTTMLRCRRLYPWLALATGLAALWLLLLAVAVIAPPNTFDSMTYHMPRVMHWIENGSVWPYATNILRQLYMGPGAEFVILHLQLLTGSDRLANMPQLLAMLGSVVGASAVARQLGGCGRIQIAAAVIAGTVPIGVLEATSTQNDLVVAFWLVCFVVFALRLIAWPDRALVFALSAGASLGLAILTKPTAYVFALPFAVWLLVALIRRSGRSSWKLLIAFASVVLVLNAGQYVRNALVFASPLGPGDEGGPTFRYANDSVSPALVASNVIRNLAVHLIATPKLAVNQAAARAVLQMHEWLDVDVNDPHSTFGDTPFATQPAYGEDTAGNPLHLAAIALAVLAALVWRRLDRSLAFYALAVASGFVLLCVVMRWQPWNTRLQLPLFVLAAPFVALGVGTLSRPLLFVLAGVLLVGALAYALNNLARPVVGRSSVFTVSREAQYLANRPPLLDPFRAAGDAVAATGCTQVGLLAEGNDWEYPLWIVTQRSSRATAIEHVAVQNVSAKLSRPFSPCVIVSTKTNAPSSVTVNGATYALRSSFPPLAILLPERASADHP